MDVTRRGLITGLTAFLAAPAIVRAGSLMPVKAWPVDLNEESLVRAIAEIRGQIRFMGLAQLKVEGQPVLFDRGEVPWLS